MSMEGALDLSADRSNFSSLRSREMSIPKRKCRFGINKCSESMKLNDELWDIDSNAF